MLMGTAVACEGLPNPPECGTSPTSESVEIITLPNAESGSGSHDSTLTGILSVIALVFAVGGVLTRDARRLD